MRLDIAYRLHFRYAAPVSESQNEIRVRPRHDMGQQVLSYRLTTTPATRVLQTLDYFGTTVDHLGVRAAHAELLVVAESSVETLPGGGEPAPVGCERLTETPFVNAHVEYLAPSQHVQWGGLIDEVATWALRSAADDVGDRVRAVARAVPTVLSYQRGSTSIGVTLEELVDGGHGVCQDFAHLAVGMLRCVGIPARYVSGYLFAVDETQPDGALVGGGVAAGAGARSDAGRGGSVPDAGSGGAASAGGSGDDAAAGAVSDGTGSAAPVAVSVQTHAWIEAAVPGFGWYALDPTNGGPVGERHVVIGHGRDYNDVAPVRGVFHGSADAEVDAEVIIAQPTAPTSMVTEPIRRRSNVAVSAPASAAAPDHQQAAQQQQ